jgi:hypothetical protein
VAKKGKMISELKPNLIKSAKFLHRKFRSRGVCLTHNDRKILAMKNRHAGSRCFILGSGPSLKVEDIYKLQSEITFACNKIYLAFENTPWRPTYYSVVDDLVALNNQSEIASLELEKIFKENIRSYFDKDSAIWIHALRQPVVDGVQRFNFSTDVLEGTYGGWTVLYMQMQLALYMGIKEIFLLGLDFDFDVPESTGRMSKAGEVLESKGEVNHFHPDYRKPGETWTVPKLELQYGAFAEARRTIESHGGRILNASRYTKLDVFTRIDFDSLFLGVEGRV